MPRTLFSLFSISSSPCFSVMNAQFHLWTKLYLVSLTTIRVRSELYLFWRKPSKIWGFPPRYGPRSLLAITTCSLSFTKSILTVEAQKTLDTVHRIHGNRSDLPYIYSMPSLSSSLSETLATTAPPWARRRRPSSPLHCRKGVAGVFPCRRGSSSPPRRRSCCASPS